MIDIIKRLNLENTSFEKPYGIVCWFKIYVFVRLCFLSLLGFMFGCFFRYWYFVFWLCWILLYTCLIIITGKTQSLKLFHPTPRKNEEEKKREEKNKIFKTKKKEIFISFVLNVHLAV